MENAICWQGCGATEFLYTAVEAQIDTNTLENCWVVSIKAEHMHNTVGLSHSTSAYTQKKGRCAFPKDMC